MPQPHLDLSATVKVKVDLPDDFPTVVSPKHLYSARFLLQQTSSRWEHFGISNVSFYSTRDSKSTTGSGSSFTELANMKTLIKNWRTRWRNNDGTEPSGDNR